MTISDRMKERIRIFASIFVVILVFPEPAITVVTQEQLEATLDSQNVTLALLSTAIEVKVFTIYAN